MVAKGKKAAVNRRDVAAAGNSASGNGVGKGKLLGYARVSTADQDLTIQRQALVSAGVATVFEEKASGTKRDGRTELEKLLSVLGDASS